MRGNLVRAARACALAVLVAGCHGAPGSSAQGAAERFLDKFYVELDPTSALPVTTGEAKKRLEETLAARREAGGMEGEPTLHVYWERLSPAPPGDAREAVLRYRLRVDSGGAKLQKALAITLVRGAEGWRVSDYREVEEAPSK